MAYRFEKNAGDSVSVFGGTYGSDYVGSMTTSEARDKYGYTGEVVSQSSQQQDVRQTQSNQLSQSQTVRQPIPDYIYTELRNAILNGQSTPRQALSSLQKLAQTGHFSLDINENRILQPITVTTSRGTFSISPATAIDWKFDKESVEKQITRGNISGVSITPVSESSPEAVDAQSPVEKAIKDAVAEAIQSGQLNQKMTREDISNIKWEDFFGEALEKLGPSFNEKFRATTDEVLRTIGRTQADLDYALGTQQRQFTKNLETQEESFSDRGLAFSGQRTAKAQELGSEFQRGQERTRELAFRQAQDPLLSAEQKIGTENLRGLTLPQVGGRSLALSSTPFTGSDVYERKAQAQKEHLQ